MGRSGNSISSGVVFLFLFISLTQAFSEDRCKDDSFCRAYCLSTNPTTVSARCGIDLQSCICMTNYNQAVKVRFVEERRPVPSTTPQPSTTQRPMQVNSQSVMPNGQFRYNDNGVNGNSINGNPQQQQQLQAQQDQLAPVLLECDASETSTAVCHSFCTMEIRAWYGLCNITSKACACFGIPPSAIQKEPIAAIFHSTAPAPTTRPTPYRQPYPPQQPQNFQQQQQWQPIPSSSPHQQTPYGNHPYPSSPSVLSPPNNQLQDQGPVRSVAGMFGSNGKPVAPSILTPAAFGLEPTPPSVSSFTANSEGSIEGNTSELPTTETGLPSTSAPATRKRRSLNDTPLSKGKDVPSDKDLSMKGECTKFKCGLACKRSHHFAPECEPKCFDGQCLCECSPTL